MSRCPACPGVNACVPGDGPMCNDYGVMFVGEAPGKDENRKGRVFIGKTGREVNEHYLPVAGLRRERVYFTNAIKCLPASTDGKLDPKSKADQELLESCVQHHLYDEIDRAQPKVIVALGSFACRALDPGINLELHHGRPYRTGLGVVFPMYHPAGGIHEPKKMLTIRSDYVALGQYLKGKLTIPKDEYAGREEYRVIESERHLESVLGYDLAIPLATDTETTRVGDPFCLTFSIKPGTGYLIRAEDTHLLQCFQEALEAWSGVLLFHHWLYDRKVVRRMGLRFRESQIRCTMQRAFHLGNVPQGLKAIAYRELGMEMQDFDDLVTPYSIPLVLQYYSNARLEEWEKPASFQYRDKDGVEKTKQPQGMGTKLKRFFTDYSKNTDKDVFEMWTKNWVDEQSMIEEKIGPWPGKCITHAPFEKVIHYACLSKESRVSTPSGYMSIGSMVRNHYTGPVHTFNPTTSRIETRNVTGHYRIKSESPIKWLSILTEHTRVGRWGFPGTRYTPDHKILTPQGMRQIEQIQPGDQIYLPTPKLTPLEWQVVYGSILGDGTISQRNAGGWANLRFSHNIRQKEYLEWKSALLTSLNPTISSRAAGNQVICGRPAQRLEHHVVSTRQHPELTQLRKDSFIVPGYKNIGAWIDSLDWLGLAVWYQDDGTLVGGKYARLYTLGFIKDEVDILCGTLRDIFGVEATSYETNRCGQWAIQIPAAWSSRFFSGIARYMHPVMQYKVPHQWKDRFNPPLPTRSDGLVTGTVKAIMPNPPSEGRAGSTFYSYCIDVEETHNFLTLDEVAKNCRDADATLRWYPIEQAMIDRVRKAPQERWRDVA